MTGRDDILKSRDREESFKENPGHESNRKHADHTMCCR